MNLIRQSSCKDRGSKIMPLLPIPADPEPTEKQYREFLEGLSKDMSDRVRVAFSSRSSARLDARSSLLEKAAGIGGSCHGLMWL
jgi:hypothetical protein